jgi:acyl-CoA thioesterase
MHDERDDDGQADDAPAVSPHGRPLDRVLLGLEADDDGALSFEIAPHLCRSDGKFYGGTAISASIAVAEAATGRPALWITTQMIGTAVAGERLATDVEVLAAGRAISQVQVRGRVEDRLVFNAVGSTATPDPEGLGGLAGTMPTVPVPDGCEELWSARRAAGQAMPDLGLGPGPLAVSELRAAPLTADPGDRPGRTAIWARLTAEPAAAGPLTPAAVGFLADMIPVAVCRALGVEGSGTSLDNSLRFGAPADTDWVLMEIEADMAAAGYGHGRVHVWTPDGELIAVGSQSARLFTFEQFLARRRGA